MYILRFLYIFTKKVIKLIAWKCASIDLLFYNNRVQGIQIRGEDTLNARALGIGSQWSMIKQSSNCVLIGWYSQ